MGRVTNEAGSPGPIGLVPPSSGVGIQGKAWCYQGARSVMPSIGNDGFLRDLSIDRHPIAALERGEMRRVSAIVLHRTGGSTLEGALSTARQGVGTHFYVDRDGRTIQAASLAQFTAHVGRIRSRCFESNTCAEDEAASIRSWGWAPGRLHAHERSKSYPARFPLNEDSVGIETVARCLSGCEGGGVGEPVWEEPTPAQRSSIFHLVRTLQDIFGLSDENVYEHDRISYKTHGEGAGLYQGSGT